MSKFFAYLRAQLRRTLRVAPLVLVFTAVLAAVLAMLLGQMFADSDNAEERQPIRIGLVGDLSGTYLEAGLFALQNFDVSRYYLEFVPLGETDAAAQVNSGDMTAYLRIPDGFVEAVLRGEDKDITYVAGNSASALGPMLMQEVADTVSDIILHAQKGVYGYQKLGENTAISRKELYDNMDILSRDYATRIFSRGSLYRVEEIGVSSGLSFKSYYVCAVFLLVLLLCGIICAPLLIKTDLSLPRLLYSTGFSATRQVLGEFLPFGLLLGITGTLLLMVAGLFAPQIGAMGILPAYSGMGDYLRLAVTALPAVLVLAAWQYLVYELTSHLIGGVLLQVLTTVGLTYVSGYLLPLSTLPTAVQSVATWLPTGLSRQYMADLLTESAAWLDGLTVLGYGAVLLVLAVLVRIYRIRQVTADE